MFITVPTLVCFLYGWEVRFAFVLAKYAFKEKHPKQAKNILNIAGGISLLALILCFFFLDDHYNFIYYGGMLLVSLLCVVLVAVTAHPGASLNRWLTNPVFTWIGKRSYGIYLYPVSSYDFFMEAKGDWILPIMFCCILLVEITLILIISELSIDMWASASTF